ncbi:metallophosphoesterase [Proteiniclasticum sp. C24MP]|uniref:metallophosphoesterase n=1 Tax=Proteiniclasticum sp. C24MP TaxID=3374101 RepID=UPI003754B9DF
MKKTQSIVIILFLILSAFFLVGYEKSGRNENSDQEKAFLAQEGLDLWVISDLHFLSPSINDQGPSFQRYMEVGDGKNLNEIHRITDAFKDEIIAAKPDGLIVSGDLTNNGERESHLDLAALFLEIEDAGIEVYVTPGNHDVNNPYARGFQGEKQTRVDTVSPEAFREIYKQNGFSQAFSEDENSLSYAVKANEKTWILMIDTNRYQRNMELGYPEAGGILSLGTFTWMKEVLNSAQEAGAEVITVTHHNALMHSGIAREGYMIDNHEEYLGIIRRSGVKLNLTGHIHIQDITVNEEMDPVYEIATNALSVYPHKYGRIRVSEEYGIEYRSRKLDLTEIMLGSALKDFRSLDAYSKSYFEEKSATRIYHRLLEESNATEEEAGIMAEAIGMLNVLYFGGDEDQLTEEMRLHEGFRLMGEVGDEKTAYYMQRILNESGPDDNMLRIGE